MEEKYIAEIAELRNQMIKMKRDFTLFSFFVCCPLFFMLTRLYRNGILHWDDDWPVYVGGAMGLWGPFVAEKFKKLF